MDCIEEVLKKFADDQELITAWNLLHKAGVDDNIRLGNNGELETIRKYLNDFPDKSVDLVAKDIKNTGGYRKWTANNLYDIIDENDDLNGLWKDVVMGKKLIETNVKAVNGGRKGLFQNLYSGEDKSFTIICIAPFDAQKTINIQGNSISLSLYILIKDMKKMKIPKGSLKQLKFSKVLNRQAVMYVNKKLKELHLESPNDLSSDVILASSFVRLHKKMFKSLGYKFGKVKIGRKFEKVTGKAYAKNPLVNVPLDKLGIKPEDEIWVGFDIIVEIESVK